MSRQTLSNGMTVFYREDKSFPLVYATLLFRSGSRQESSSEAGLCSMTVDLLMQGTRHQSARKIASVMELVGASMGTQVHEDYSEMGFVVPSAEIDRAFGVMTEVLTEPSFPPAEIAKEKSHVMASLASRRDAIFNVAYDPLSLALYGEHPYGRPIEGTDKTVRGFKRSDFKKWHDAYIRPESAILSWIGPLPERQAMKILEKHLEHWGRPQSSVIPAGRKPGSTGSDIKAAGLRITDFRGDDITIRSSFEQAYLMTGWQAPPSDHKDQVPLKVLNTLLGGGMSSRLFATLREKLSLAYEVSSFYPSRVDRSEWVIYLGLPKEKLKIAAQKLEELLQALARQGPTTTEVNQAKAMIRGAFVMDRQSRRRQALYRALWEFLGRGPRYGEEFLAAVDRVTPKEVQRLLQAMLEQPRVTVRVVPKR